VELALKAQPVPLSSLLGILLMTIATILFAAKDVLAKMTGGYYSPVIIIWTQVTFLFLAWFPYVVYRHGWDWLIPKPFNWQVARGLSIVAGIGLFYWAILLIPLADATAMAFTAPLIVTALSPLMLGEKVGPRRWAAVIVGFLGALVLLRPAFNGDSLGYVIAFSTGLLLGFYYTTNRKLASAAPPLVSVVYGAYFGVIVLTPAIPFFWSTPRPEDWGLISGFAVLAAAGQTLLILSFQFGQASLVAPFHYIQIVAATIFGFFFFAEFPGSLTWAGVAIVIASGLYIVARESKA